MFYKLHNLHSLCKLFKTEITADVLNGLLGMKSIEQIVSVFNSKCPFLLHFLSVYILFLKGKGHKICQTDKDALCANWSTNKKAL